MQQATMVKTLNAADENAVTSVLLRYALALDTRDWQLFRSCFAEDLEADYGCFGRWHGPREITDYMRGVHLELGATLHRISNISVWWDEGQACARSYVDAILMPAQSGAPVHRGIGWYDDRLVRTSSGWRISRRTFHPVLLE